MLTGGDSAAHCVRCGMVRTTGRERGGGRAEGEMVSCSGNLPPPPFFFLFLCPVRARHSARHGVPKRNLLFSMLNEEC